MEARGPLPAWPWWPRPLGCVVVFLVVVVVPVMGFLEVDSVTRAGWVVFLPARRDKRLGLRPVVVVGAVVVRVRAIVCSVFGILRKGLFVVSGCSCGAEERRHEA